jgi:hypothetical protein
MSVLALTRSKLLEVCNHERHYIVTQRSQGLLFPHVVNFDHIRSSPWISFVACNLELGWRSRISFARGGRGVDVECDSE